MAEDSLSGFFKSGLLVFFIISCLFFVTIELTKPYDTELDPYIQSEFDNIQSNITNIKNNNLQGLTEEASNLQTDPDSYDIGGDLFSKGFKTITNGISSQFAIIQLPVKLAPKMMTQIEVPGFIIGFFSTLIIGIMLFLIIKAIVSRSA